MGYNENFRMLLVVLLSFSVGVCSHLLSWSVDRSDVELITQAPQSENGFIDDQPARAPMFEVESTGEKLATEKKQQAALKGQFYLAKFSVTRDVEIPDREQLEQMVSLGLEEKFSGGSIDGTHLDTALLRGDAAPERRTVDDPYQGLFVKFGGFSN